MVNDLLRTANRYPLVLLTRLLDGVQLDTVRLLFAVLRDELVSRSANATRALVPPIVATTSTGSEFPLHADLFGAERLLNVFGDVTDDSSGAALLLSADEFTGALIESGAPHQLALRASALLRRELGSRDRFDEFMALVYPPDELWCERFREICLERSVRIEPRPGDGYLLDDRRYLHGREWSSADVKVGRLVRLVFALDESPSINGKTVVAPPYLQAYREPAALPKSLKSLKSLTPAS